MIDNAPTDDRTQELVASLPTVRYVQEPKAGLNFARNQALEVANTELLAFLDDDVVVDRLWFEGLITAWAENPDAAAWTGLVLPYELETEAQILFESRGGFGRGFEKIRYGQILPQNPLYPCGAGIFGAGCNMAFRRDVLLKLGGFDEALDTGAPLPGGGDLDIFYRMIRSNNVLVYEPQYLVYHQHRRESEKLRRQYWSWGLGLMAFVAKSYQTDPPQREQLQRLITWWFQYQTKQLIKSWTGRHPLPAEMILAEIWGGIRGLFGEYPRSQQRIEQIRRQYESI
ncbi:glycosyl transferase family 2 [Leptolyngbya sp. NIES-3755]|nr:glycosyl transferase family 2 [Leptolyngbya sp. NIES-3755]